jgi:hypothetical protein
MMRDRGNVSQRLRQHMRTALVTQEAFLPAAPIYAGCSNLTGNEKDIIYNDDYTTPINSVTGRSGIPWGNPSLSAAGAGGGVFRTDEDRPQWRFRHSQAQTRSLAGLTPQCPFSLHPDPCLLAEPNSGLVLDPLQQRLGRHQLHRTVAGSRPDRRLHRRIHSRRSAFRVDQAGRLLAASAGQIR